MLQLLLTLMSAVACPAADEAERDFDYAAAAAAVAVCLEAVEDPSARAALLVRQGVLQAELRDPAAARARFEEALALDREVRPRAEVSPKTRALFDEVLAALPAAAPDPTPDPKPDPKPDPTPAEPTPDPVAAPFPLGWTVAGAGAVVVAAGAGLIAYGVVGVPGIDGLTQVQARNTSFAWQRAGQVTLGVGALAAGVGLALLFVE